MQQQVSRLKAQGKDEYFISWLLFLKIFLISSNLKNVYLKKRKMYKNIYKFRIYWYQFYFIIKVYNKITFSRFYNSFFIGNCTNSWKTQGHCLMYYYNIVLLLVRKLSSQITSEISAFSPQMNTTNSLQENVMHWDHLCMMYCPLNYCVFRPSGVCMYAGVCVSPHGCACACFCCVFIKEWPLWIWRKKDHDRVSLPT